jgi:hypothetical protein
MRRGKAATHYASCLPRTAGSSSAVQPQNTIFQAIQAEEEAKTGHRVLEIRTTRSILFCNRQQELVHFVWIQVQQRFLKLQTDHSAQLTATPLLLLVNN